MSYLITIEPGRSEVGIKNNGDEITRDTLNNIYQTKMDLTIRSSKNGTSFPLVIASSDQSSHRDELQASEIFSVDGMGASSEHPASTGENRDEESDAGVETRSCGKISDLISHFKNVQATSSRPENVPHTNVPTKKLRMDFQNLVVDKPSSPTKTIDFTTTNKDLETAGKIPRGSASLPVVKLQFKMHTEEATQLHQNITVKNKIIKQQEQFLSRNNITTKPLVKPRSFMSNQTDHNVHQQSEHQSKDLRNKNPPEGAQLSPIVDDSKRDQGSSDITESKRLQWRKQPPSNVDARPKLHTSNTGDTAVNNLQESSSAMPDHSHTCSVDTVTKHPSINSGEETVCGSTVKAVGDNETRTEINTPYNTSYHETDVIPVTEKRIGKDDTAMENEITSVKSPPTVESVRPTEAANGVELLKHGNVEVNEELVSNEVTAANSLTSDNSNDGDEPVCTANITGSNFPSSEPANRCFVPEIKVSFDGDDDVGLVADRYADSGSRAVGLVADRYADSGSRAVGLVADRYADSGSRAVGLVADRCTETGSRNVDGRQDLASVVEDDHSSSTKYSDVSDRINDKLDLLKSELMAMRKMDLVLLRQLININQTMQRIQRADVLRMSRSLSFLSRNMTMPRRGKPVERQNSAPHCADRRRFLFSHLRSNTEDDFRDSLSSFDESEADSAPSEVEESTHSLNSLFAPNSPMTSTSRQKFFQSHDLLVSLDVAEDVEQNYEDILNRNVRLWKMSFHRHQSVQEEINAWF